MRTLVPNTPDFPRHIMFSAQHHTAHYTPSTFVTTVFEQCQRSTSSAHPDNSMLSPVPPCTSNGNLRAGQRLEHLAPLSFLFWDVAAVIEQTIDN